MNRRFAAALLVAPLALGVAPLAGAAAQPLAYEATVNGVQTLLTLRVDGAKLSGTLQESGATLPVRGEVQGRQWQGVLLDPGSGRALARLSGSFEGEDLLLRVQPEGGNAAPVLRMRRAAAPGAVAGPVAAFVGRWRNESQINSSGGAGGFASFSTARVLELSADGRARQSVRSAGGGGDWSFGGGEQVEFVGRWQVRGAELWIQPDGQATFSRIGTIRRAGEVLVIEINGRRQVWSR